MVEEYKTSDIWFAAALILHNHELKRLEPTKNRGNQDVFHFVFANVTDTKSVKLDDGEQVNILPITTLLQWYVSNSPRLKVEPASYSNTIKYLKEKTRNYMR